MKQATIKIYDEHENEIASELFAYSLDSELYAKESELLEEAGEGATSNIVHPEKVNTEVTDVLILPMKCIRWRDLADDTVSITFNSLSTPTDAKVNQIRRVKNTSGVLMYKSTDEITKDDLEILRSVKPDPNNKGKSKSQVQRDRFFVWWKEDDQGYSEFDDFYNHFMDSFIKHINNKIDVARGLT